MYNSGHPNYRVPSGTVGHAYMLLLQQWQRAPRVTRAQWYLAYHCARHARHELTAHAPVRLACVYPRIPCSACAAGSPQK